MTSWSKIIVAISSLILIQCSDAKFFCVLSRRWPSNSTHRLITYLSSRMFAFIAITESLFNIQNIETARSLIIMHCCRSIPETVIPRTDWKPHTAPISVFHHCRHLWALFAGVRGESLALCPNVSTMRLDAADAAADTISFTFLPPDGAMSPPETVVCASEKASLMRYAAGSG